MLTYRQSQAVHLALSSLVVVLILVVSAKTIDSTEATNEESLPIETSKESYEILTSPTNEPSSQARNTSDVKIERSNRGRSSDSRARTGRMMDLDLLVGDLENSQKNKLESVSGNRQSRILNEDIDLSALTGAGDEDGSKQRKKKSSNNKNNKMSIQGFIPIVTINKDSDTRNSNDKKEDNEDDELNGDSPSTSVSNTRQQQQQDYLNQLAQYQLEQAGYGQQTSTGHASTGIQPLYNQQVDQNNPQMKAKSLLSGLQSSSSSTSKKLLGPTSLLSSLVGAGAQSAHGSHFGRPLTAPSMASSSLLPPLNNIYQQHHHLEQSSFDGAESECICVPFYMCRAGHLSDSSLSKLQLQKLIQQHRQQRNANQQQQQQYQPRQYQPQQYQPQQQQQQLPGNLMTESSVPAVQQQDMLNEAIYEQLRQSIESGKYGQLPNDSSSNKNNHQYQQDESGLVDERSNGGLAKQSTQEKPINITPATNSSQPVSTNGQKLERGESHGRSLWKGIGKRAQNNVCGMLRTCCKLPPQAYQFLPNDFATQPIVSPQSSHYQGYLPHQAHQAKKGGPPYVNINHQSQQQQQQQSLDVGQYSQALSQQLPPYHPQQSLQHVQYLRPVTMRPPTNAFVDGQSPAREEYALAQSISSVSTHPQQLINHRPLPGTNNNQLMQQLVKPGILEGRCGMRQSSGISGRVQNLQYHDNSAEFGEFPSQAAVLKRLGSTDSLYACAATLISHQWLATAAHCIRKFNKDELKVRLGDWDVHRDDEFYPHVEKNVKDIVIHTEFVPGTLLNDIALVRLDSPIDAQLPHISPACLPSWNETFTGQRCWVTGWGKDAFGQRGTFQSVLKKVDLPVISQGECENSLRQTKLGPYYRLHQGFICAGGERGKDACEGDGGSGLYCINPVSGLIKAAGLVSWGIGCGQQNVPGVYVNMARYVSWIEDIISIDEDLYNGGVGSQSAYNVNNLISERSNNVTIATETNSTAPSLLPHSVNMQLGSRMEGNNTTVSANSA